MKVVMLGAGGWGALVGACLSKGGADVTLLFRRQEHVDEIDRNGGLTIQTAEGEFIIPVRATTHPDEVDEADLLIVAVKNHDTPAALASVRHMRVRAVASVQNGLGHCERFREQFPHSEVFRMVSRVSGSLHNYGRVQRGDKDAPTWVGNPFAGITPLVEETAHLFKAGGLPCESSADIEAVEWCKLIWWTPLSITAVLSRLPSTEMMQSPDYAYLMVMITRDMVRAASALGITVKDYPTIEVMERVNGSVEEGVQRVIRQGRDWEARGGKGYTQAMLLDIERKRKTEIEDTAGIILRLAQERGVATPYLECGYRVVRGYDERVVQ